MPTPKKPLDYSLLAFSLSQHGQFRDMDMIVLFKSPLLSVK
jgi:hypothetical protein